MIMIVHGRLSYFHAGLEVLELLGDHLARLYPQSVQYNVVHICRGFILYALFLDLQLYVQVVLTHFIQ